MSLACISLVYNLSANRNHNTFKIVRRRLRCFLSEKNSTISNAEQEWIINFYDNKTYICQTLSKYSKRQQKISMNKLKNYSFREESATLLRKRLFVFSAKCWECSPMPIVECCVLFHRAWTVITWENLTCGG